MGGERPRSMEDVPVKNEIGRILFSEARSKLRYVPRPPLANNTQTKTPHDILNLYHQRMALIRIVKG